MTIVAAQTLATGSKRDLLAALDDDMEFWTCRKIDELYRVYGRNHNGYPMFLGDGRTRNLAIRAAVGHLANPFS
jgi:hypothetical protein